jgi:DNA-binding NarL/FixJ family response regulator
MHLNPEHLHAIAQKMEKRINLLIVDDFPLIRNALIELFASPLFNTVLASSEKEAREIIPAVATWHAWILDIAMENDESGLKLLADNQHFPFIIMLSGIRSMNVSSRAMQLGAYKVFDKDPSLLSDMHDDVCSMAALAYILKGAGTKYFSLFKLLLNKKIAGAEAWAQAACLTKRQLERVCSLHLDLTPRFIVPLYHTIRFLLQHDSPLVDGDHCRNNLHDDTPDIGRHVALVYKNIDIIIDNKA